MEKNGGCKSECQCEHFGNDCADLLDRWGGYTRSTEIGWNYIDSIDAQ